jgi:hypothetical protein
VLLSHAGRRLVLLRQVGSGRVAAPKAVSTTTRSV